MTFDRLLMRQEDQPSSATTSELEMSELIDVKNRLICINEMKSILFLFKNNEGLIRLYEKPIHLFNY